VSGRGDYLMLRVADALTRVPPRKRQQVIVLRLIDREEGQVDVQEWTIRLGPEHQALHGRDPFPDAIVALSVADAIKLSEGTLNPLLAFGLKRVQVSGDRQAAIDLGTLLRQAAPPPQAGGQVAQGRLHR